MRKRKPKQVTQTPSGDATDPNNPTTTPTKTKVPKNSSPTRVSTRKRTPTSFADSVKTESKKRGRTPKKNNGDNTDNINTDTTAFPNHHLREFSDLPYGENEYDVETILQMKKVNMNGKEETWFLVKWTGFENETSWEPEENLYCTDLVQQYLQSQEIPTKKEATEEMSADLEEGKKKQRREELLEKNEGEGTEAKDTVPTCKHFATHPQAAIDYRF